MRVLTDEEISKLEESLVVIKKESENVEFEDLTPKLLDEMIELIGIICMQLAQYAKAYKELADKAKGL